MTAQALLDEAMAVRWLWMLLCLPLMSIKVLSLYLLTIVPQRLVPPASPAHWARQLWQAPTPAHSMLRSWMEAL